MTLCRLLCVSLKKLGKLGKLGKIFNKYSKYIHLAPPTSIPQLGKLDKLGKLFPGAGLAARNCARRAGGLRVVIVVVGVTDSSAKLEVFWCGSAALCRYSANVPLQCQCAATVPMCRYSANVPLQCQCAATVPSCTSKAGDISCAQSPTAQRVIASRTRH